MMSGRLMTKNLPPVMQAAGKVTAVVSSFHFRRHEVNNHTHTVYRGKEDGITLVRIIILTVSKL